MKEYLVEDYIVHSFRSGASFDYNVMRMNGGAWGGEVKLGFPDGRFAFIKVMPSTLSRIMELHDQLRRERI